MTKQIAIILIVFAGALLNGCDKGPTSKMQGAYLNSNQKATLEITADKMIASGGPLTITADYKIISVDGDKVTVELTAPNTPKGNMVVAVADDALTITNNFVFGGHWTRK